MADDKKYYYMRLKENFFDSDNMLILESMPDGYLYCNILLKLYLRSLKDNGRLMLNGRIPYNPQMLATVTRHHVGTVEKALNIFIELGLVDVLDNGAIYMMDIQNYIGKSTTEADRKRVYREKISAEKRALKLPTGQKADKCPDKSTPEIEIEKEIDIELEKEKEKKTKPARHKYGQYENVLLSDEDMQKLQNEFPYDWQQRIERLSEYIASSGKSYKNHLATIRSWARKDKPQQRKSYNDKPIPEPEPVEQLTPEQQEYMKNWIANREKRKQGATT